ncbi:hypothetical protein Pla175_27690 [Pirellulimonas nuda]|uniref:Uncharacterized protein n=1 Tax=Pirellulimonas nuda TaxID=2528009 RepID=A0A518DD44_9BACT|nr:hypothetical protein Pla175_27690 [Pirellulimonas nuda]
MRRVAAFAPADRQETGALRLDSFRTGRVCPVS